MRSYSDLIKVISNYVAKLWGMFSVFLFVPFYIKYLGVESYAVIGFYVLILGVISFADAGLSSAVIREFSLSNTINHKYSIFKLIEKRYQFICIGIAIGIFFLAPFIAEKWLKSYTIPLDHLINYIRLIGIGTSIQLITSLYFGGLFGLGLQVEANLMQLIWNISKSGLVIVLLLLIKNDLYTFFIWQIVCNITYVFALRIFLFRKMKKELQGLPLNLISKIPKTTIRYIAGMSLVAVISSINTQVDKLVISSSFSLKIYGYYSIASILSQLPLILVTPLATTVFPFFSKFASNGTYETSYISIFKKTSFLVNIIVASVASCLLFYAEEIIVMWTKGIVSKDILPQIVLALKILTIGSVFLAIQLILYYVLLSFGKTKYTIFQGIFQILIGVPLLYFFVNKMGLVGATISWVLINFGAFVFLFYICLNHYLLYSKLKYLFYFVFIPFFVTTLVFSLFYSLYDFLNCSFILITIFSVLIALVINLVIYNKREGDPLFSIKKITNFNE